MEASKWEDRESVKERPENLSPEELIVEEETIVEIVKPSHASCECCKNSAKDSGTVLGGIGFVTAFIPFLSLPALIVSIVAVKKSRGKNGLAIAGIIVSLLSFVIMLTVGLAMGAAALAFIQSINEAVSNVNHVTQVTDQAVNSVQGLLPNGSMVEQLGSSTQNSDLLSKAQELLNTFIG